MKFIFDENGNAINSNFIKRIYATRIYDIDHGMPPKPTIYFRVAAEMSCEEVIRNLKEFKTENEAENFEAAKKYFAEVVESLNGEIDFLFNADGLGVINAEFVKSLTVEVAYYGDDSTTAYVIAEVIDEEDEGTVLKEIESDDEEKNIEMAEKYLATLVENFNAGK